MRQSTTLFVRMAQMIPKSMVQNAIEEFDADRRARTLNCRVHLLVLLLGHLRGVNSLRHLVTLWGDLPELRGSLGLKQPARSTLADANRTRPHEFFRAITAQILEACLRIERPRHRRLKRICYSLDSTTIELCADLFSWAYIAQERAAIRLHTLLRTDMAVPQLTTITEGVRHDLKVAREMPIPPGSIVSIDRGYFDARFHAMLHDRDVIFVTRMRRAVRYKIVRRRRVPRTAQGIRSDREIVLTGKGFPKYGERPLRRIGYRDPETGKILVFMTNSLELSARTIARLYKDRWQVELFFKWIKQNLKIQTFWGRSQNAVLVQLWVALLAYALVSWINLRLRKAWTRLRTFRFVQDRLLQSVDPFFWVADVQVPK